MRIGACERARDGPHTKWEPCVSVNHAIRLFKVYKKVNGKEMRVFCTKQELTRFRRDPSYFEWGFDVMVPEYWTPTLAESTGHIVNIFRGQDCLVKV